MLDQIELLRIELGLSCESLLKFARDIARNRALPSISHLQSLEQKILIDFLTRASQHQKQNLLASVA